MKTASVTSSVGVAVTQVGNAAESDITGTGATAEVPQESVLNASTTLYAQWKKVSVGKVSSVKAKAAGSSKLKLNWKKIKSADGYVVEYSTDKSFKKSATKKKTVT